MAQRSSFQTLGRAVGGSPDGLVRLVAEALVRLATAALVLVVAMLVINPLASSKPLSWTTFSSAVAEHSQPPPGAASPNNKPSVDQACRPFAL